MPPVAAEIFSEKVERLHHEVAPLATLRLGKIYFLV